MWVDGSNINLDRPTEKLAFKRPGPFPVVKKVGPPAYRLKIPKMWKNLRPVMNESKLILPPPNLRTTTVTVIAPSREGVIQEVERILNSRRRGDELQYLVK